MIFGWNISQTMNYVVCIVPEKFVLLTCTYAQYVDTYSADIAYCWIHIVNEQFYTQQVCMLSREHKSATSATKLWCSL